MSGKSQAKGKGRRAKYPVLIGASRLKAAAGFTLIEVLIAMTLLSIMVVLLFSSLSICAKSWEQGESKIAEVNEAAVVYNFFQRHLSSAIPLWDDFTARDGGYAVSRPGAGAAVARDDTNAASQSGTGAATENKDKTFSFQGKKQSLQFVSAFPASARRTGMQLFSIETQQQDGEQDIKVTLTPFYPVAEGEEWHQEEVVLLKHINDFELAYFGVDDSGEGAWQDEWLEKDVQPRLVKISINTDNGIYWPDMIIALKVAGAGAETDTANGAVSSPDSN
ncbi:prepilin-type N-terminal cleavage/methylation domain-containing protein [Methylobacter sp. G7]|uniref:prepilin-type N-terminal cleavage/methylation domain-containing protein n=1 Tax=Methylobacter sp. G7 TaxID=3230117 RepID=UPI003D809505